MKFPQATDLKICFAHPAYQMAAMFAKRKTGIDHFQVWDQAEVGSHMAEVDVLVTSGFWRNKLITQAPKLKFVQSISAGINQYDQDAFGKAGIRLASAAGVNSNAVAEHAMALMLALVRHIHWGRDRMGTGRWRGLISDLNHREDELAGKTILIVGAGRIGQRLAQLAGAFQMTVLATKRNIDATIPAINELHEPYALLSLLPRADFVVLTCPLNEATTNLINEAAFAAMKPSAFLVNVARGGVVDEKALLVALANGQITGAGLDTVSEEPLPADSAIWQQDNVILTPHSAGETRRYEDNVIDILLENLHRLGRGEPDLLNQIV